MEPRLIEQFNESILVYHNIAKTPFSVHTNNSFFDIHHSALVSKEVVKNHGENLLIVLQKATSRLAKIRNTLSLPILHVFLLLYGITIKNLQASSSYLNK